MINNLLLDNPTRTRRYAVCKPRASTLLFPCGSAPLRGNIFLIFLIFFSMKALYCSAKLYCMDWPSHDAVLTRNFGWNDSGRPVLGLVFSGGGEVLAAETGELIFSRGVADNVSRLPSPLGAWTAIDHGDGLISIYSRYGEEKNIPPYVERQSPVAAPGISGWSGTNGFYFMLYDRRDRSWINPAIIITPALDMRPPQIMAVTLQNAQGQTVRNDQLQNLSQGRYRVTVTTTEAVQRTRDILLAPYRVVCSINGAEAGSLNLESVSARDGVLMIHRNGLVPARQVYSSFPAFEAAEVFLNRGQASLEIIVQDIAGNSRRSTTRMFIY